ncbi:MAG: mannose-1-phosphate guanylyltransferase [Bacteroidota bacterium]|nr:mannose-1-phosphate guanylyltransferase [Bacteroidota bacterium]MDP4214131.1 mannose-1-phosphate guanylyltransferase [Bacteroidota bacterium]MDP4251881.1 mannose-1-phosphate guanylyltransferase [Bacteroidota bacterium]
MNEHQYAVIMAGGIGSRFWPMSRQNFPKQFLDILNTGQTLIQSTFTRLTDFILPQNIYVVTSNEYIGIVKEQLPNIPHENILGEPSRKNTAPCIAYISFKLMQKDPKASLIVAPADHMVTDRIAFKKVCLEALSFVNKHNALITLGITPLHPNTGYGYIQRELHTVSDNVYKVKTFTEKPNLELAKTFLASGDFLWNAGIFVWQVKNVIKAFENYLPEMYDVFLAEKDAFNTPDEKKALDHIYPLCTSISIDFGIMEKANNVYVIPSSFGWSDLGTWNSAYENLEKDFLGNAIAGDKVMVIDARDCIVHSGNNRLVVLQGMKDFIIVDSNDVLLICKREKEQEIKDYVAEVRRNIGDEYL